MSKSEITMVQLTPQEEAADGFTEIRRILSDREQATMEALADADAMAITAESLRGQLTQMGNTLSPLYSLAHSRPDLFPTKVGESLLPAIVAHVLKVYSGTGDLQPEPIAGMPAKAAREAMQARILELEGVASDSAERVKELQGVIADMHHTMADAGIVNMTGAAEWFKGRMDRKKTRILELEAALSEQCETSGKLRGCILELEKAVDRAAEKAAESETAKKDLWEMIHALRLDLAEKKRAMAAINDAGGVEAFRQMVADAARKPLLDRIGALESENTSMRDATASAKRALAGVCPF